MKEIYGCRILKCNFLTHVGNVNKGCWLKVKVELVVPALL